MQLNEVPPGTLDRYWGDVAVAVAAEAAGGVQDVHRQRQRPRATADAATTIVDIGVTRPRLGCYNPRAAPSRRAAPDKLAP